MKTDQLPHEQTDAHRMKNKFLKKVSEFFFFLKYIVSWTKIKKHILAKQNLFHSKTL